jgi:hypothetical protein
MSIEEQTRSRPDLAPGLSPARPFLLALVLGLAAGTGCGGGEVVRDEGELARVAASNSGPPAACSSGMRRIATADTAVSLRTGAGTEFPRVSSRPYVFANEQVTILSWRNGSTYSTDGEDRSDWLEVQIGTDSGFSAAAFFSYGPCTGSSTPGSVDPASCADQPGTALLGFVTGVSAFTGYIDYSYSHKPGTVGNVLEARSSPSPTAPVRMRLLEGAAVAIRRAAITIGGEEWYPVDLPGTAGLTGYVPAGSIAIDTAQPCKAWGPAQAKRLGATHTWARYTYRLPAKYSYPAKASNITVGARNLDGVPISPSQTVEFSFNARSGLSGGQKYGSFYQGHCESGPCYAGGICGLATTWFRSLFLSGLPITTMVSHGSFYWSYNYPGADAMVYEPYQDLTGVNDSSAVIVPVVWSEVVGGDLHTTVVLKAASAPDRSVLPEPAGPMFVPVVEGSRYVLRRSVIRSAGTTPFSGTTKGSVTVSVSGDRETWSFRTTYSPAGAQGWDGKTDLYAAETPPAPPGPSCTLTECIPGVGIGAGACNPSYPSYSFTCTNPCGEPSSWTGEGRMWTRHYCLKGCNPATGKCFDLWR